MHAGPKETSHYDDPPAHLYENVCQELARVWAIQRVRSGAGTHSAPDITIQQTFADTLMVCANCYEFSKGMY